MIILPEAERDIVDIVDWYEEQREGLGARFRNALDRVLQNIARMPEMNRVIVRDVRRAIVPRFPFVVYYRLRRDEVVVLCVAHGRRDSSHWMTRL